MTNANSIPVTIKNTKTGETVNGRKVILCEKPLLVAYIAGNKVFLSMPEAETEVTP